MKATLYMCPPNGVAAHLTIEEPLTIEAVHQMLQGPLEVIQLDAETCLLVNADARTQMLTKNVLASKHWFDLHPESGAGADFIVGPALLCQSADIAHLDHLHAGPVAPALTDLQRVERAALLAAAAREQTNREEARALCASADSGECLMCGS